MTFRRKYTPFFATASGLTLLICALILGLKHTHHPAQAAVDSIVAKKSCIPTLGEWKTAAEGPTYHLEGATAVVRGKLYVFTGFASNELVPGRRVDVYNPETNIWETRMQPRQRTPLALSHVQAAADGRYIWLAGGFIGKHPGKPTKQVWKYDTVADTWTRGPDLPSARAGGALIRKGRTLHYFGGLSRNRDNNKKQHWTLNLDNPTAWVNAAALPDARVHLNGVALGGMIYAIGGQFRHDTNPVDVNLFHGFNSNAGTWTALGGLPTPRSHFEQAIVKMKGKIVIIGGRNNQGGEAAIDRVTMYDPVADEWSELRALPTTLLAPVAAYIKGKLIVTYGGADFNKASNTTYVSEVSFDCSAGASEGLIAVPPEPSTK